jgi:hypothetical protein
MITAVERLQEYLSISLGPDRMRLLFNEFEKAKEMEKKQIINAYFWGRFESDTVVMSDKFYAEQYYNETFKTK